MHTAGKYEPRLRCEPRIQTLSLDILQVLGHYITCTVTCVVSKVYPMPQAINPICTSRPPAVCSFADTPELGFCIHIQCYVPGSTIDHISYLSYISHSAQQTNNSPQVRSITAVSRIPHVQPRAPLGVTTHHAASRLG